MPLGLTQQFSAVPGVSFNDSCENCDIIVAIGGDSSVLHAAKTAIAFDKPLLGINSGRIGYLSAVDFASVRTISSKMLSSMFEIKRSLLYTEIDGMQHTALNDIVVSKQNTGKTIELLVLGDGVKLARWRCDGVIISTPTGSTAYNISAGGPIVAPTVEANVVTPVCAHSLLTSSLVLPPDMHIEIQMADRYENLALVSADGEIISNGVSFVKVKTCANKLRMLTGDRSRFINNIYKIGTGE